MNKIILIVAFSLVLASCGDKIPKLERKTCDGSNKTLADVICKK